MVISVSGFGNTGSSALIDYLREFDGIKVLDEFEFQLLHQPDGINDLKYHLTQGKSRIGSNVAIKRFIDMQKYGLFAHQMRKKYGKQYDEWWKEYIDSLVCASWNGYPSNYDPIDVSKQPKSYILRRIINHLNNKLLDSRFKIHVVSRRKKFFSFIKSELFDEITKKSIFKLFNLMGVDLVNDLVIVDMLFSATNPQNGMEFFDNPKSIIVNRDPRDVFVTSKLHQIDSRFMPNNDAINFISYYKTLREDSAAYSQCMFLDYEDLIYDYFNTTKEIRSFLGLKCIPTNEFVFFDPLYSVRYTFRKDLYKKYSDDIAAIEKDLSSYLYNFDSARINDKEIIEDKKLSSAIKYKGFNIK